MTAVLDTEELARVFSTKGIAEEGRIAARLLVRFADPWQIIAVCQQMASTSTDFAHLCSRLTVLANRAKEIQEHEFHSRSVAIHTHTGDKLDVVIWPNKFGNTLVTEVQRDGYCLASSAINLDRK